MRTTDGHSAFQVACTEFAPLEVPKFLLENYKKFGIDIMHGDNSGFTALDLLEMRLDDDEPEIEESMEEWEKFKTILEEEYAKIFSLEQPAA